MTIVFQTILRRFFAKRWRPSSPKQYFISSSENTGDHRWQNNNSLETNMLDTLLYTDRTNSTYFRPITATPVCHTSAGVSGVLGKLRFLCHRYRPDRNNIWAVYDISRKFVRVKLSILSVLLRNPHVILLVLIVFI